MKEIILSAPGKNAISTELMHETLRALEGAAGEPILLTGAGDAFSAGLNLKQVVALDPQAMKIFLELLDETVRALWEYPGPSVALVNGHAIAGGCLLALSCDHRVMTSDGKARIGLNEVALGLRFPPKVLKMAAERVPRRHWERVILGAELFDARTAVELGLVDEISDEPSRVAGERLALLGRHPKEAYARAKQLLRGHVLGLSPDEIAAFHRVDLPVWTSDAARERIHALLKR